MPGESNGKHTRDTNGKHNGELNGNGRARSHGHENETERSPKVKDVMVPGQHSTSTKRTEVSEDSFAAAVLDALPADLLYRSSGALGVLAGRTGFREFDPVGPTDIRLIRGPHLRLVEWVRTGKGNNVAQPVKCNEDHGKLVVALARRSDSVRHLVRVVQCPVYGTNFVASVAGWSPDGTFFDALPDLAKLEPEMQQSVIEEVLEDLVIDFPFKDEASRQNFFGLLLTPILRPAINGNVPLHLVLASLERTGKTKLLEEVLGGIIFGRPTPALQMTGSDEELDKRVVALLSSGKTLLHLDNLGQYLDSAILASLLTSTTYLGRELGKSKMLELPNTLVLTASGNNVKATGEIVKRTVPIQLQPKDGRPEDRVDFVHMDLRDHVRCVRPAVLSCLMGMVERWKKAGRPIGKKPMGGFEAWARIVGGVMQANGFDLWLSNAQEWRRAADPDSEDLETLVTEWARLYEDRPQSTSDLLQLAQNFDLFPTYLNKPTPQAAITAFSKSVLKRNVDRPVLGVVITRNASGNNSSYQLVGDKLAFREIERRPARETNGSNQENEVPSFF